MITSQKIIQGVQNLVLVSFLMSVTAFAEPTLDEKLNLKPEACIVSLPAKSLVECKATSFGVFFCGMSDQQSFYTFETRSLDGVEMDPGYIIVGEKDQDSAMKEFTALYDYALTKVCKSSVNHSTSDNGTYVGTCNSDATWMPSYVPGNPYDCSLRRGLRECAEKNAETKCRIAHPHHPDTCHLVAGEINGPVMFSDQIGFSTIRCTYNAWYTYSR